MQRRIALHRRQRIAATRQSLADAPFGTKMFMGIPSRTTAVHTLDVASKDEHFVLA